MEKENLHQKFMQRCLQLARNGLGSVSPNPLVGCVIVHNGLIIGEGYHRKFGEAHAEVNAIAVVKNKSLLEKATLYVNLEPCSHFGKTPPCCDLIIKHKIPHVVIGCIDSFAKVAGNGIKALQNAGCNVEVGILEAECREINKRFFTFHEKKRPYIILKWAQTLDGFIDINRKKNAPVQPTWITNSACKILVHKWRSEEDAFMAGTNTVVKDNPQLTTREWSGRNPIRIIPDRTLRIPKDYFIYDQSAKTIIFTEEEAVSRDCVEYIKIKFSSDSLQTMLHEIFSRNIQSVVVEGGAKLLNSFIKNSLWDEARVFYGNKHFIEGISAPKIKGKIIEKTMIGDAQLLIFKNK